MSGHLLTPDEIERIRRRLLDLLPGDDAVRLLGHVDAMAKRSDEVVWLQARVTELIPVEAETRRRIVAWLRSDPHGNHTPEMTTPRALADAIESGVYMTPTSVSRKVPDVDHGGDVSEHAYVSTACRHERHARCRRQCKFCDAMCACRCHATDEVGADSVKPLRPRGE